MAEVDTQQLSILVGRLRDGDESARDELIRASLGRLERLAGKMLRKFPSVQQWEETGDVLHNALIRLDRALRAVVPVSSRAYFGLAAEQIRRELLDLARHYQGRYGPAQNQRSLDAADFDAPADPGPDPADLELWAKFHAAVEELPAEEREAFMLTYYQGWEQPEIAELFQVSARTIRRWWTAASELLRERLGGELPR